MPLLRQLPELLIRGSIANVTMASLSDAERRKAGEITEQIINHPEMQAKRHAFARELAATIGADYRDDRLIADNEYAIAIWRGVVGIIYHKKYDFHCRACGSSHWMTERGLPKPIDRQYESCPNCKQMRVETPGDTELVPGTYITKAQYKDICDNQVPFKPQGEYGWVEQNIPTCSSPIDYIPGDFAHDNPWKILDSVQQMVRFFGEYVWNYFRQQLAENQRKEHNKKKVKITAPADEIMYKELIMLCKKMRLDHSVDDYFNDDRQYVVYLQGNLTPPEFTVEYLLLQQRALDAGITIEAHDDRICVLRDASAPLLESTISLAEHVLMQEEGVQDGDDNVFTIQQVHYRTMEGVNMDQEDHVQCVESSDVMTAIRCALPDGDCQVVFDIDSQTGPHYTAFSEMFGDKKPKKTHIAQFLGTTTRQIGLHRDNIRGQCLIHNMVPG